MASSLAQQLSQVRSHNAAQLGNAREAAKVQSASYLFPPNVASSQDLQLLQALGANGWEELIDSDAIFSKWDNATGSGELLFGTSSRDFDRLMKTKEENEQLDRAISNFLHLVGGSLLDRSTGKCLEWLVRRFRIHQYNVEMVLAAFMPYHETQEFARMLQLLNLNDKTTFSFLLPVQKQAATLPSSILLSTILAVPSTSASLSTLRWVVGLLSPRSINKFSRPNHALQSFCFSIIIKICDKFRSNEIGGKKNLTFTGKEDIEQLYLSVLLPTCLDAAITTQLGSDCQMAGCIALSMIATSFNLSNEARESVVQSLKQAKMEGSKLQKATQTTIKLLRPADELEEDEKEQGKATIFVEEEDLTSLPDKSAVSDQARCVKEEHEAFLQISHMQDEQAVYQIVDRLRVPLVERIDNWTSGDLSLALIVDKVSAELQKELRKAVEKKPESRKTATKIEAHLINQMAVKVDPSRYTAIVSMTDQSTLAASVYKLAVTASFVNTSVSSGIITNLFSRLGDASLTFLASIWTTIANPVELRYAALHHTQSYLAAFSQKGVTIRQVDFQAIVPSLLVALKDSQAFIRATALLCLEHIADATASIEKNDKAGVRVEVFGYDSIYGKPQTDSLRYLDIADSLRFLRSLLKVKESFLHDEAFLNSWMQSSLNVIRGEGKRESSYKSRILEVLLSHIVSTTSQDIRVTLLDALIEVHDASKMHTLLPLLKKAVSTLDTERDDLQAQDLIALLFGVYDASAIEAIEAEEDDSWTYLLTLLDNTSPIVLKHVGLRLQKSIFSRLSDNKKTRLYAKLVDVVANAAYSLPKEILSCLTHLDIAIDSLVPILSEKRNFVTSQALQSNSHHKKAKVQTTVSDESAWSTSLSVIIEISEATLARKASMASGAFIVECLEILRLGIELILSRQSRGEYLMQISMSNLGLSIDQVSASQDSRLKKEITAALRIDTIVNVIKTPCRPQTFQQALLLLSKLGKLAPEVVLHNAMPIFTFVGSTMLQRDDDYSFIVIEKTLQSILPAVIEDISSKHQKTTDQLAWLQSIRPFLLVFTDAAKHIPRHRRLPFYNILIKVLGPDYLAPVCMLLTDRLATKVFKQSESDTSEISTTLQLPLSLFATTNRGDNVAEVGQLLRCLNMIWEEVVRCWTHRSMSSDELQDCIFLDCTTLTGGKAEHEGRRTTPTRRVVALVRFIHLAMKSRADDMEDHLRNSDDSEDIAQDTLEGLLRRFIESALSLSQVDEMVVKRTAIAALEDVMKIAPASVLFGVTSRLIKSESIAEKQSGLHLCSKSIFRMSDDERIKAASYTPKIINDCYQVVQKGGVLASPALEVLKAISEDCVPSEHVSLSSGLPILIDQSVSGSPETMQLLIALSNHLGPRLIPHLKTMLSMTTSIMTEDHLNPAALTSSLKLLSSLIKAVPVFMTSHLEAIIDTFIEYPDIQGNTQASSLLSSVVRFVAPAELLTTLISIWEKGNKSSVSLHSICLNLMERLIKASDRQAIMASYKTILRYLLSILDARRHCQARKQQWSLSTHDVDQLENKAVSVFLRLILKLNENAFRPLYLRFCDWSLLDLAEEQDDSRGFNIDIIARKIVLYKVINALMTELGELVGGYYLNILDATVETLQDYAQGHIDQQQEGELWKQMMTSLLKSAKADKDRGTFWNENRCKAVMPGLISQMSLLRGRSSGSTQASSVDQQLLGSTIAALCRTVPDEGTLKLTNNLLLEQTRSDQVRIKIIAIQILERLWKSKECEDVLLRLVPETVPSIAELLQESDVIIQEPLSGFVAAVEVVLGENLDTYLQ